MSRMRCSSVLLTSLLLLAVGSREAKAQPGLTGLSVSGSPAPMIVSTAVAGSQPTAVVNTATTYDVTAKLQAGIKKIVGQIDAAMPFGTTLTINLTAVSGATSLGAVALDMTARDLEINVSKENRTTSGITYTFTATVAAGVIPSQTRTVTLTLLDYP